MGGAVQQQQQQSIPDAPAPQPSSSSSSDLGNLKNQVAPGKGTTADSGSTDQPTQSVPPTTPQTTPPSQQPATQQQPEQDNFQQEAPDTSPTTTFRVSVNYVDVPTTVRDKKGNLVSSLTWRHFKVFEDGQRQRIVTFSTDAVPLSVAFVIDQSLPSDVMHKVNESLAAVTGAFTPSDTVAVLTYNTSPATVTDFTGAQGARLPAALVKAQKPGRQMGVPITGGPLAVGPTINGRSVDPTLNRNDNQGFISFPKEVHPLNDAILYAAGMLSKQPRGRRRVIYVISDGKEARSKASYKEVVRILLTNEISVYGTLVGDSATWGIGYLDKLHLPLLPTDNILPKYAYATGGSLDAQLSEVGIQKSFARLADSVRTLYTIGYISHQPILSGKYHSIDVRVDIPGLTVQAKDGYYPSSANMNNANPNP